MVTERSWATPMSPYVLGILRISYGILWLHQTLWKIPPDFGMAHGDGLFYWTKEMAKYSFLAPHRFFVESVVLPHFLLFAWLTLLTELFIAFSHLLGVTSRLAKKRPCQRWDRHGLEDSRENRRRKFTRADEVLPAPECPAAGMRGSLGCGTHTVRWPPPRLFHCSARRSRRS